MRLRLPLVGLAGLSLLAALWAGLIRIGWPLPLSTPAVPVNHGPLLVVGFLGTLIGLERAVALRRSWAYAAPVFAGLAGLSLLVGLPGHVGHGLAAAGSAFLLSIFVVLYRAHPQLHSAIMGLGAILWLAGNVLWHRGAPLYQVVPWWIGFLVLTIAGERLELSRLLRLTGWSRAGFFLASGAFVAGLFVGLVAFEAGVKLGGIGLLALAFWLLRFDLAWRSLSKGGLARYTAVCLLSGHLWLGVGGILWLFFGNLFAAGPHYDAMLHAVLLGFVFSMIFGHAPVILPAVTGVAMPFRRAFYGHWALLHLSLSLRVTGDLAAWAPAQRWGGLLSALAILLFLANNVRAVRLAHTG